jgi:predicted Holliday junction resolvase-like endonuclease
MIEILTIIVALVFLIVGYLLILRRFTDRIERKIQEIKEEARQDALRQQRRVIKGLVSQELASLLPDWPKDLHISEARFMGKPVDYLVFKGMDEENITEVVFVEVKSGESHRLGKGNETSLKAVIQAAQNGEKGKIRWEEYHLPTIPKTEA